jgi:prepilin-type N-terminal cleavage/methylation domain-containing protein
MRNASQEKLLGSRKRGFTTLELVMALMLLGVMAVFAGLGLETLMGGFTRYRAGTDVSRKTQLAMARIIKEFSYISSIESGSAAEIRYGAKYPPDFNVSPINTLSYSGRTVTLNGHVLADGVEGFQLGYCHFLVDPGTGTSSEHCGNSFTFETRCIAVSLTLRQNDISRTVETRILMP